MPEPLSPTIATVWPAGMRRSSPSEDGAAAAVAEADAAQLDGVADAPERRLPLAAERLGLQVHDLVQPVDRHQRVLDLEVHRGQPLQGLEQVDQQGVEEHQLADRQGPVHDAVAAVPEDHDPRQRGHEHPQRVHADAELLEREQRPDQHDQPALPRPPPAPARPRRP